MSDADGLIAEAEIGDEAKRFVESDLGKTILGIAEQEVKAAQEALESVDPMQPEAVRALQNQAKVARNFEQWLVELIDKGENALQAWRQANGTQE